MGGDIEISDNIHEIESEDTKIVDTTLLDKPKFEQACSYLVHDTLCGTCMECPYKKNFSSGSNVVINDEITYGVCIPKVSEIR